MVNGTRFGLDDGVVQRVRDTLTNPAGTFEVPVHNKSFATQSFTQEESDLLISQLNSLLIGLNSAQLGKVVADRADTIARVATHAKQELDSKVFGGINAGDNEIGFSVLRPGQIRADPSTGDPVDDWYFDPGTTGWTEWIGDGSGANYTVGEDQVVVVFAFQDQEPGNTEISGINVDQFGRNMDMLPQDMNDMRLRDNETEQQVQELPTLVASDNDDVHVRLRYDRNVESQPRFYGFSFGIGAFLNNEDYA
jgi:hypothetical protein